MKWDFLMYIKVLNKQICFTAEKKKFANLFTLSIGLEVKRKIHGPDEYNKLML